MYSLHHYFDAKTKFEIRQKREYNNGVMIKSPEATHTPTLDEIKNKFRQNAATPEQMNHLVDKLTVLADQVITPPASTQKPENSGLSGKQVA
jgi:hypothetical protein